MTGSSTFTHIIGTETEHRLYDSTGRLNSNNVIQELRVRPWPYGLWAQNSHRGTNGSRSYQDASNIIESAGPECTNGTQAMYYELAGSLFWSGYARICDRALGRAAQAWVIKANTSAHGASSGGHHTNISMPMGAHSYAENLRATVIQLKAFVATLQLISGAGLVLPREQKATRLGTPAYGYAISARAFHVTRDSGSAHSKDDMGNKPLFLDRNEALADKDLFWRLQICGLDSNILPTPIQLSLDILLILAEMAALEAIEPIQLVEDENLGHTAQRVSLDWRTPLDTDSHGTLTPLEIQWHYFHEAEVYVLKHRDGRGSDILEQWAEILTAFDTDEDVPSALNGKVDWVTKLLLLQGKEAKPGRLLTCDQAENLHFNYHAYRINASGVCLPVMLARHYGAPDLIRQVLSAMRNPPSDTRAWARGIFVASRPKDPTIDWQFVEGLRTPRFKLPDPSAPSTKQFDEFCRFLSRAS